MSEASKTPVWEMPKEDLEIQVVDLRAKLTEALDRAQRAEEFLTLSEERRFALLSESLKQSSKIAALEKDAARYRFIQLEDNHAAVEAVNHFFGRELDFALDVAIDKALASSGQGATESSS